MSVGNCDDAARNLTVAFPPMRILYVRNLSRPIDFGGNRYPLEVTTRLASRGHEVIFVTGRFSGGPHAAGVRYEQYQVWRPNPLLTFWSNALGARAVVARVSRARPPDVVVYSPYDGADEA